ncbi:unnamed protein product, partial [marine sediment metagenome]
MTRADPAEHIRSERAVAVIIALALMIMGVTIAYGDAPKPPTGA